jgi:hypothetical protein
MIPIPLVEMIHDSDIPLVEMIHDSDIPLVEMIHDSVIPGAILVFLPGWGDFQVQNTEQVSHIIIIIIIIHTHTHTHTFDMLATSPPTINRHIMITDHPLRCATTWRNTLRVRSSKFKNCLLAFVASLPLTSLTRLT